MQASFRRSWRARVSDSGRGRPLGCAQGRRYLATEAAAPAKTVTVPTNVYGISGRYASALYVSAAKAGTLKQVHADLGVFKSAFESNENFKRYVNDPTIDRKTKAGTMTTIMKDSSEVTRKFVGEYRPSSM